MPVNTHHYQRIVTFSLVAFAAFCVAIFASTDMASAQAIGGILCDFYDDEIEGAYGVGSAIATFAVIAVGIGALVGKISWGTAVTVAVGIGIVAGANRLVDLLGINIITSCDG